MTEQDFYKILGLAHDADARQVKDAYRERAFKYHPDQNMGNPAAAEKMKQVNEAYAVLSDPSKRREYDMLRQQYGSTAYQRFRSNYSEQDIFSGSDINQLFEEMARSFGLRGVDEIFKESYGSGYQTFKFKRPGVFAAGIIFSGLFGQPGSNRSNLSGLSGQGSTGKLFQRAFRKISGVELPLNGSDLSEGIQLTARQASEGGPYAYYLKKTAKKLVVQIPPGVRDGQKIRLKGMGGQGKGGGRPGDLYLKVRIWKPWRQRVKAFAGQLIGR